MTYNTIHKVGKNRVVSSEITYNTIGEFGILMPQTKTAFNVIDKNDNLLLRDWFDTCQILENGTIIIGYIRSKEEQKALRKYTGYTLVNDVLEKYKFRYGAINSAGELIIEPLLDFLEDGKEDTLLATYHQKKGFFSSTDGTQITPICFIDAHKYQEGLACVRFTDYYGYIDKRIMRNPSNRSQYQIPAEFIKATDFHDGQAEVSTSRETFIIDHEGKKSSIKKLSLRRNWYNDPK